MAIRKGDRLTAPESGEAVVASRDEYNRRVYTVPAAEYEKQSRPGAPRAKETPWLVMPDGSLVRDYEHGFPDEKGSGIPV